VPLTRLRLSSRLLRRRRRLRCVRFFLPLSIFLVDTDCAYPPLSQASSWSNWTSAKASDAKSAVSSAASSVEGATKDAYNTAASSASSLASKTSSAAENAGESVKEEGKSWYNWGGAKAEDAKDATKEALLKAERGVEHGAQHAQHETKKL
jgi:hypothetical protein